jgi:hypothetical protein
MPARELERSQWERYFDQVSRKLAATTVTIEVSALDIGDRSEVELLPLSGLTFDPRSNVFEVALENIDHLIPEPVEIYAQEGPAGLESVEVVGGDGTKQIIKLTTPLPLAAD